MVYEFLHSPYTMKIENFVSNSFLDLQVGHRTYQNLKTIRPNMALLGQLFLNKSLTWPEFQETVVEGHKNRHGQIRLRKSEQSIYTYPTPDCMCNA